MATFEEFGNKLEIKLKSTSNFKIGKTGYTAEERYNQEYLSDYNHYEEVGRSDNSEDINKLEEYLIKRFKDLDNCDNDQIGGGEMTESDIYCVYIVYNY